MAREGSFPENIPAMALLAVAQRAAHLLGDFAQKNPQLPGGDELGIGKAYMDLYSRMLNNPYALTAMSMNLAIDYARLWQAGWMRMAGQSVQAVAAPAPSDSRFKDQDWSDNFLFDFIKQSYLITARHIQHAVAGVDGLSEESQKKVAFFTRQYVDALAPSNFALSNPQVLRETFASGGKNLRETVDWYVANRAWWEPLRGRK